LVELPWTSDQLVTETFYLTTNSTENRYTSPPPAVFEPTISAGEQPEHYVLDRAVNGTER
jgi:hypothetical protein